MCKTREDFERLLASPEKNRKKKKYFPDFWLIRNYLESQAYDLAYKYFSETITPEEIQMTKIKTYYNKLFWIIRGYSEDYAKKVVSEIQSKNSQKYREKYTEDERNKFQTTRIEYYLHKGYSQQDAEKLLSERQSTFSLDKCIIRYGEDEGKRIWLERQKRWQDTLKSKPKEEIDRINLSKAITLTGMIERYGDTLGTLKFESWKDSRRFTLNRLREKYGETEGNRKYKILLRQLSCSLPGFIEKYGEIEGTRRYELHKTLCKNSLENFIKRHGEDSGRLKYEEYVFNKSRYYSQESLKFFKSFIPEDIMNIARWGDNEYFLRGNNAIYFYDFKYEDIIIEYHGSSFHVNPKLSEEEKQKWRNPFSKESAEKSIEKDRIKRELALSHGYKYFEIYSNDDDVTKNEIKDKILKEINEKNKNKTIESS
jgi:hypothetical protein